MWRQFTNLIVVKYWHLFLGGVGVTLQVSFAAFAIALAAALAIAFMRRARFPGTRFVGNFFVQLTRNTPILVSLVWFFYAFPTAIGVRVSPLTAAIIALGVQSAGYQAEVYRAGIESIEAGQIAAAKALGMTNLLLMRRIVLPQAFRRIVPPTVNVFSTTLKSTSVISIIAAPDLMYHATRLTSYFYKPMEIYSSVAIIYIILVGATSLVADWLDRRMKAETVRAR